MSLSAGELLTLTEMGKAGGRRRRQKQPRTRRGGSENEVPPPASQGTQDDPSWEERFGSLLAVATQNLTDYEKLARSTLVHEASREGAELLKQHEECISLLFCMRKFRPRASVFSDSYLSTDEEEMGTVRMRSQRLGSTQATMVIHGGVDDESDVGSPWDLTYDGRQFETIRRHSGFSDGSTECVIRRVARNEFQRAMKAKFDQLMEFTSRSQVPADVLTLTTGESGEPLLLGSGGYSRVYHGRLVADPTKEVAVKVLPLDALEDPRAGEMRDAAVNELTVLSSLSHRHMVVYVGAYYSKKQNELWCAMGYCKGRSLNEEKLRVMGEGEVVKVGANILSALAYLAEEGWVHRDVKPENILDDGGGYLLSDFGLARRVDRHGEVRSTTVEGTLQYLAPEAFLAPHCVTSHKSDVYSLGITLLALSGVNVGRAIPNPEAYTPPPFAPKAFPPTGTDLSAVLSPLLFSFITDCLQDNPDERQPASALLNHPYLSSDQ